MIFRGFIAVSNAIFCVKDTTTDAGAVQPTAAERSGKPGVAGRRGTPSAGRAATSSAGPDAAADHRLHRSPGHASRSGCTPGCSPRRRSQDRADLVVRELQRTGAFDRKALVVVTTTGTGWVDPASVDALEYVLGGDTAIAAMQYSYLPSWISFLADKSKAQEAGVALFRGVYDAWSKLPADHRPQLYMLR